MKKVLKSVLAAFLLVGLVACGGGNKASAMKIGVGSVSNASFKEEDHKATVNTTVAGVALKDDKIAWVSIDTSQQNDNEIKDGKATATAKLTKKELKEDYGMKAASPIEKEWYEQIAALEEAMVGKTADEVKAMMDDEGLAADEDVKSSVTMHINDYIAAVEKAIANAVEVENVAKVGLGHNVTVKANDDNVESVLEYAVISVDADGKITYAGLDNAQVKVAFDANGITSDLDAEIKTKGELGADYGMKKASEIEKEWNEQNDALATALVGKTLEEVAGLNDSAAEEEDLKTSVTIYIGGVKAAVANAGENLVEVK